MARCPDCNKFCGLDSEQEPEIDLNVGDDGTVDGTIEISNCCADCGTEITKGSFEVNVSPDTLHVTKASGSDVVSLATLLTEVREHLGEGEELEIEVSDEEGERTSRVEGKGRGARTFYGFTVRFNVNVSVDGKEIASGSWEHSDEVQASSMEEAC